MGHHQFPESLKDRILQLDANDQQVLLEIKQLLMRYMDGVTADILRQYGAEYKYCIGLSIPQIKNIGEPYRGMQHLAEIMREHQTRELQILAIMLYPPNEVTASIATDWFNTAHTQELRDVLAYFMLANAEPIEEILAPFVLKDSREEMHRVAISTLNRRLIMNKSIPKTLFLQVSDLLKVGTISTESIAFLDRMSEYPYYIGDLKEILSSWRNSNDLAKQRYAKEMETFIA